MSDDNHLRYPDNELVVEGDELHCPVDGCDEWWPVGMGYCYPVHREYHEELERAYNLGFRSPRGSKIWDYEAFEQTEDAMEYLEEIGVDLNE